MSPAWGCGSGLLLCYVQPLEGDHTRPAVLLRAFANTHRSLAHALTLLVPAGASLPADSEQVRFFGEGATVTPGGEESHGPCVLSRVVAGTLGAGLAGQVGFGELAVGLHPLSTPGQSTWVSGLRGRTRGES